MNASRECPAKEAGPPLFLWRFALATVAACALLALAFLTRETSDLGTSASASSRDGTAGKLIRSAKAAGVPDIAFKDAAGRPVRLSDWRGRMVLLNIWATWCGPCKTEMTSLDKLQATLGDESFTVLALSTDRAGPSVAADFFARQGIQHLEPYNDQTGDVLRKMKTEGLPTSILLNENGQEVARVLGPLEWDSPDVIEQLRAWKAGRQSGPEAPRPSL